MAGAGYKSWVDGDILTAADVNTYLMQQAVMVFDDAAARTTALPTPSEGMVSFLKDTNEIAVYNGTAWVVYAGRGYQYVQTVYFTSSGTFTKATYPWLRAVKVKTVGGGGGGGYAGGTAAGSGGGGGASAYAESFILATSLSASETVTVGAGGAGGVAATDTDATDGTDSSFGALVVADAGGDGQSWDSNDLRTSRGGEGGVASSSTGDFKTDGQAGTFGALLDIGTYYEMCGGTGGASILGGGGRGGQGDNAGGNGSYGAGGGGAGERTTGGNNGGDGGAGIVIVELYA